MASECTSIEPTATHSKSLFTHVNFIPALVNRPPYSLQPLAEEAQQERDATACNGTTPSTPPDLSKMYSSQTTFTVNYTAFRHC